MRKAIGYFEKIPMTPFENSKKSFQRLEFLGDRVLDLIISEYLYQKYQEDSEGKLNDKLRFVSNDNLDEILDRLDDDFKTEIGRFKRNYKPDDQELSADDIEAFIGDYYLEHGLVEAKKYFENIFAREVDAFDPNTDYISLLQIHTQKKWKTEPEYVAVSDQTLQNNEHEFLLQVFVCKKMIGKGSGKTKLIAKKQAALAALKKLSLIP